ncbi:MAG: hypothetical protein KDC10_05435 [Calditrichaeota bacterium]|nr:hypothetical protein [Candidatus Cloacimonadota bacterium]MCA9786489.1 hypothetical protein [Candidatus Cloacimonadota bacterium]MCB1046625.1 hypothetical protein [Calditrichota bacterium]
MMRSGRPLALLALCALGLLITLTGCDPDEGRTGMVGNESPQTHLSLGYFRADTANPDTLDQSVARLGLSWWGEDRDGTVDHYLYRWSYQLDSLGQPLWTRTDAESDTFIVLLTAMVDTFSFHVKAVDDDGAEDPSPARVVIPVRNSPPEVDWIPNSQELLSNFFGGDTSWTFPHLTFRYNAWDLDGSETITEVNWALDDTSQWNVLDPVYKSITLDPGLLTPGPHRMFLRARDVAQSWSNTVSYPGGETDTTAAGVQRVWMVRQPMGPLLVVFDDPTSSAVRQQSVYEAMDRLGLVEDTDYTTWEISSDAFPWLEGSAQEVYYWLPAEDLDVYNIFSDFEMVFWFSYASTRLLDVCPPMGQYLSDNGKVLLASTDVGYFNTTEQLPQMDEGLCLPIESLTNARHYIFPLPTRDHPLQPAAEWADRYPEMHTSRRISFQGNGISDLDFGFVPDSTASELYFTPEDPNDPVAYPRVTLGSRTAAAHDPDKARFVYMGVPLYWLDNLDLFLQTLIEEEFNW